jgi:phosphoribosylglycinamide formyltransferase-1
MTIKIAILASGSGSNAQAIMNWAVESDFVEVVCVLSDKKNALVLERATMYGVPALLVRKKKSESREEFDQEMIVRLADYNPDWIVLAGFMKLLTPVFLNKFQNRIVNIHPSLLPLFPGTDGYGDAFRAQVKESGCTIHFVDGGMDTGKIIDQKKFNLIPGESFEEFKARGLKIENEFYPIVLEKLFKGLL